MMQEPHPAVAKTLRMVQKSLGLYWFPALHADKFSSDLLILDNSKPFFQHANYYIQASGTLPEFLKPVSHSYISILSV